MSRRTKLVAIPAVVAVVAIALWIAGDVADSALVRFVGLMVGATTFVPLPADAFVLSASRDIDPLTVGLVGGAMNALMVLVERRWLLIMISHPSFDRFARFFDNSRVVALANRNMFLGLLIGGASFIPFEPFRLIAVVSDYSPVRYAVATFISRGGRYYALAALGAALVEIGIFRQVLWLVIGLFIVGLLQTVIKILRSPTVEHAPPAPAIDDVEGVEETT